MLEWWQRLSNFGKVCGVVAAITSAIVGIAAAVPIVEPYMVAHRGFVRDSISFSAQANVLSQTESQRTIRDLQIEQAEGKREAVQDALLKWAVEANKTTDTQTKQLIAERLRELAISKRMLDSQIDTLNKVRQ